MPKPIQCSMTGQHCMWTIARGMRLPCRSIEEYAAFETAALAAVSDDYYFGAYCGKCEHHVRLSLVKLRARLGDDFPLIAVRERLRCRHRRSRHIIVTFLSPDHSTGDLRRFFELPVS
jgi:hypothetical protein